MKEKEFQKIVMDYLKRNKWERYKTHGGRIYNRLGMTDKYMPMKQQVGWSDIIAFKNGITLFIELKSDTGTIRPEQKEFQQRVENIGFHYFIVKPKHWVEFQKEILWKIEKQSVPSLTMKWAPQGK